LAIVFGALFNAERLRGELADREMPIDLRDEKGKPTPHARVHGGSVQIAFPAIAASFAIIRICRYARAS
jgi:hypothetical protein